MPADTRIAYIRSTSSSLGPAADSATLQLRGRAASLRSEMPEEDTRREAAYAEVCTSYHAIDDFRMKLLGLLPVATGTGVFLLLNGNDHPDETSQSKDFLFAIGLLGFAFTLGLFAFELYGIKRCHYLIRTGQRLEAKLRVDGQFLNRPQELMGFIYEPLASGFIYSASMAAWLFLLVAFSSHWWQVAVPGATFALGMLFTLAVAKGIDRADRRRQAVQEEVARKPTTMVASLAKALKVSERNVQSALGERTAVKANATVAMALARMDDWGWLTVLDGRRPLGTVGEDDLKRAASHAKVDEVLGTAAR
jgi:hypothetical protein